MADASSKEHEVEDARASNPRPNSGSVVTPRLMPSVPDSLGFPNGYFVIRNMANCLLWDVSGNLKADGTMVHLFREKEIARYVP